MRVLVTGGRDFDDEALLRRTLNELHAETPFTCLIHGDARGADRLAGQWAGEHGVEEIACPSNWRRYGRGAGIIRNRQMLEEHAPDVVVAFPGGRGTRHMAELAEKAGVRVVFSETSDSD